jgi:eukaryotic-like serine/threonine-protein kinase
VLHRDLKPGNVLVTREGIVKIADFGLSVELEGDPQSEGLVGTLGYMAPELLWGEQPGKSSDWYSVGVMLYEALSGHLPFEGFVVPSLVSKMSRRPRDVRELVVDAPTDLSELCMDLISRETAKRPTGVDIIARLTRGEASSHWRTRLPSEEESFSLIGRERELEELQRACRRAFRGEVVVLQLHGDPGVGKTSLVEVFFSELEHDGRTVILKGRCFERESVPYRAVDSLMDSLTSYLCSLGEVEASGLLPTDIQTLARLFPVLKRLDAVATDDGGGDDIPDRQVLRLRAFQALKKLLSNLSDQCQLVIWLDDLQWSDVDSAELISEILHPLELQRMFFLASYRTGEHALLPELERALSSSRRENSRETISVEPLSEEASLAFARSKLPPSLRDELAAEIAVEASGNPFFIIMLAASASAQRHRMKENLTLEQVINELVQSLPESARRLLSVTSISHRQPLNLSTAAVAAEIEGGLAASIELLRSRKMVRVIVSEGEEEVQFFHDRIRESVIANLTAAELRVHHRRLAHALEKEEPPDPEAIASHLADARETRYAAQALVKAATLAAEKLAFHRAARLYGRVLELGGFPWSEERRIRVLRGDALRNAGRGPEAAREYLAAVHDAPRLDSIDLRRRAAEQLLLSGHTLEGRALFKELLREQGITASTTKYGVFLDIAVSQFWIRTRELRGERQARFSISAEEKQRLDVTWSATWGHSVIEPVEARAIQSRHLLHALQVGDPLRVARALLFEVAHASHGELRPSNRTLDLYQRARMLVEQLGHPYTTGLWLFTKGMSAFLSHRFADSLRECDVATKFFRSHCTGVAAELMTLRIFAVCSLFYLGELSEMKSRVRQALRETRSAGDLVGFASMSGGVLLCAWLVDDELGRGREVLLESGRRLGRNRFSHGVYWELFGEGLLDLYAGRGTRGYLRLKSRWREFRQTRMNLVPVSLVPTLHLRGALAVAAASKSVSFGAHRDAVACARKLDAHSRLPGAAAMACFIKAAVAFQKRRRRLAIKELIAAEEESRKAELACFVEVARLRRGTLLAGQAGEEMMAEAWDAISLRGVARPDRFAELIAPGFPDRFQDLKVS